MNEADRITIEAAKLLASGRTFRLAENPLWDERRGLLFWTDIDAGELWCCAPGDADAMRLYEGEPVGGFTLEEDGRLALFRSGDIAAFSPDHRRIDNTRRVSHPDRERFNDVIALPDGSVLAGSIGASGTPAQLQHILTNGTARAVEHAASAIGNGFAVLPAQGSTPSLLWTDTPGRRLVKLAIDEGGKVRVAMDCAHLVPDAPGEGFPDGLTIDTEGRLYSARWAGSCVRLLDRAPGASADTSDAGWSPVGRISVGTPNVTACIFGGDDLSTLFITTAGGDLYIADTGRRGASECRSLLFC
jgi:D-xylonolactonase